MKLKSINPHDQSIVGELDISTSTDVIRSIDLAKEAFQSWREVPIADRVGYI